MAKVFRDTVTAVFMKAFGRMTSNMAQENGQTQMDHSLLHSTVLEGNMEKALSPIQTVHLTIVFTTMTWKTSLKGVIQGAGTVRA